MSNYYDELRTNYSNRPTEEKLAALRSEMTFPISSIRGYVELIKRNVIDGSEVQNLPEDFEHWIIKIEEHGEKLQTLLEILS